MKAEQHVACCNCHEPISREQYRRGGGLCEACQVVGEQ